METEEKIRLLMSEAVSDREGVGPLADLASGLRAREPLDPINIRSLADRGFGKTRLFRILLTNVCAFSCDYCPMRAGREIPRHALAPSTLADVFLDTFPFNGGATASDALSMGVPVVTCSGDAFAARMAGSLLHAIGLPGLVTDSLEAYEALAAQQDPLEATA